MSELIHSSVEGGIGRLRLSRPQKRNALNHALVAQARSAVDDFVAHGIGVAVLEAEGPVWCAGADIDEALADRDHPASEILLGMLAESPLFWIAALAGPALGAGVGAAALCPVVICTTDAWFGLPEHQIGLFPAGVMAYMEPLVGPRLCIAMGVSGEPLTAEAALSAGLANEVVTPAQLEPAVARWGARLLEHPAVTDAARKAWQQRFAHPSYVERKRELDALLETLDAVR